MNLAQFVHKWARATPRRPAVAVGSCVHQTYEALSHRVAHLAGGLAARGLQPGDRVGLLMKNEPQYFECLLACWHAGLAPVPINAKLHAHEAAYILEQSAASLCFASPSLAQDAGRGFANVVDTGSVTYKNLFASTPPLVHSHGADDLAWLFYTSGTTGQPKGAIITHRNLMTMSYCYLADVDPSPPWRAMLHPAPLSHGSGLYALPHFIKGSCQVLPESAGFDPAEIFDLIAAWPGAVFFAAPTMIKRLTSYEKDRDSSGLKSMIAGGAPMHVADVTDYLDRFSLKSQDVVDAKLCQVYGQGESPMTITSLANHVYADREHPLWQQRVASVGLPQSAIELRTVNEGGDVVGSTEVGEVICRGDSVVAGYWQNAGASAKALRDGWLWTGDMGSIDEHGYLTLKDRSKDLIISGGSNIYPREVEEVLARHPNVAEVSVIGKPDSEWGEIVVAYVSATPGAQITAGALDALCLDSIARFKRPKLYRFVEHLPKNNYGKILKTALREQEDNQEH